MVFLPFSLLFAKMEPGPTQNFNFYHSVPNGIAVQPRINFELPPFGGRMVRRTQDRPSIRTAIIIISTIQCPNGLMGSGER